MFNSINDARTAFVNDGLLEVADYNREREIIEHMYYNDCSLEKALDALNAWI